MAKQTNIQKVYQELLRIVWGFSPFSDLWKIKLSEQDGGKTTTIFQKDGPSGVT
jgi:hypothetical protein